MLMELDCVIEQPVNGSRVAIIRVDEVDEHVQSTRHQGQP